MHAQQRQSAARYIAVLCVLYSSYTVPQYVLFIFAERKLLLSRAFSCSITRFQLQLHFISRFIERRYTGVYTWVINVTKRSFAVT